MSVLTEPKLGNAEFKAFQKMIFELAGISLADSKHIMVQGRLSRRLRELQFESYAEYLGFLRTKEGVEERTKFINALTTNKTAFFRERHHFEFLMNSAFPAFAKRAKENGSQRLRIWCSASSTGEEPYNIAMMVREFFGTKPDWDVRVLASDIDTKVLSTASAGVYTEESVEEIPREMLFRYFDKTSDGWSAKTTLRDLITFRRINLMDHEWPINCAFDIVFCRNVMIYFNAESQKTLIEKFAKTMQPEGYLLVGHSESLFGITDAFSSLGDTVYKLDANYVAPRRASDVLAKRPSTVVTPKSTPTSPSALRQRDPSPQVSASVAPRKTHEKLNSVLGPLPRHTIIVGEVHASRTPVWISTLLGSCLATCLYDEESQIGGMNHFLIPNSLSKSSEVTSLGVHAMELLINEIMKLGGNRRRLKAKLFGGASVVSNTGSRWTVGARNIEFAESFLRTENIELIGSHTGGQSGMHVYFNPHTTKAIVRLLDSATSTAVSDEQYRSSEAAVRHAQDRSADVTLF